MNGKWFRKQMRRVLREEAYEHPHEKIANSTMVGYEGEENYNHEPVRFELTSATGGRILTVRRYDHRKGDGTRDVYLIPSGEDVGQRVAKILNLELIK